MSRNHNAVARATYTGEPYGQALTFVRTHGLIEGLVPDSGAWTAAAQDLAASPGIRALWREPTPATAERAAADHLRQRLRSTADGWSAVLRRIHLFARHPYLDFVTGLPHAEEVAGP